MELEDVIGLLNTLDNREIPDEEFAEHAALSQQLMPKLDDMQKLTLYGLYKQTISGNAPKSVENLEKGSPEYYKWQAWRSFFDVSRSDSKRLYVYFVDQYKQVADISANSKGSGRDIEGVGSSVSTLYVDYSTQAKEWLSHAPLLEAVHSSDENALRALLTEAHQNINEQYDSNMTALHFAVDKGLNAIVKLLLEFGANINAQDDSGQTPLMYAIICGHNEIVQTLLSSDSIDCMVANEDGDTAFDLAAGDEDVLMLLKEKSFH